MSDLPSIRAQGIQAGNIELALDTAEFATRMDFDSVLKWLGLNLAERFRHVDGEQLSLHELNERIVAFLGSLVEQGNLFRDDQGKWRYVAKAEAGSLH